MKEQRSTVFVPLDSSQTPQLGTIKEGEKVLRYFLNITRLLLSPVQDLIGGVRSTVIEP